jgi:hypothetical protein
MFQTRKSKLVLFIVIFIIILTTSGLVLGYFIISNYNNSNPYFICYGDICCEYRVYNTNEFPPSGSENITISIVGNNVTFNQTLYSLCSPPISDPYYFGIDLSLVGNNLTLRENYDTKGSPPSRCEYLYIINGTIINIPEGTYNLIYIFKNMSQVSILYVFEITILV